MIEVIPPTEHFRFQQAALSSRILTNLGGAKFIRSEGVSIFDKMLGITVCLTDWWKDGVTKVTITLQADGTYTVEGWKVEGATLVAAHKIEGVSEHDLYSTFAQVAERAN